MMQGILREVQGFVVLPNKSVGNGDSNVQLSDISKDILQLQNVVQSQLEGIKITKQKKLWEIIAEILNKEFHLKLTASQVENKWRTLLRAYKNVTDNNNKTGRGRKVFQYQEEMDIIFCKKKNINPEVLLSNETIVAIPESITSTTQNKKDEHNSESPLSSRMEFVSDTPTHSEMPMKNSDLEQRSIKIKRIVSRNDVLEKIRLDRQKQHEQIVRKIEERIQLQKQKLTERKWQNYIQEERNTILRKYLENSYNNICG
ncbi:unnamed protein product [Ceutorhynchus assimilis]|uniref:Myb/SANT-like DNA-binding domain-containing protein n=1 Tax=Ceutorhynchus assimilis TaxID=467358 RepID=A0A9N9MCA0_9CUCU|nr:unnamed protein product [Ceutorhynchus assimilis]